MAKKNNNNKKSNNAKKQPEKKPTVKSKPASDLLKKYGLSDEHVPSEKEIETLEAQREGEKQKGKVASIADDIGWDKPKILCRNALYGVFMGMSDAVPGYSGGTTLNLIGFYEELISNVKLIFKPDVKKYFWKYLLWFLPFLICWIGVLIGFMYLVKTAGAANRGVVLVFLFGSFALFSIPLFYIANKDKIIDRKLLMNQTKEKSPSAIMHWVVFSLAAAIMLTIGLVARFVPEIKGPNEVTITGVTFAHAVNSDKDFENIINEASNAANVIQLLVFSIIAGFVVLIPGLSGGLIMFMSSWYSKISILLGKLLEGNVNGLPYLVTVVLGAILGVVLSVITINTLIKKYEQHFYSASLGFVALAPVAIFSSLSSYDYSFLSKDSTTLGLSLAMIVLAIIINGIIFTALNETKKIDYPKLRIFNKEPTKESVKN